MIEILNRLKGKTEAEEVKAFAKVHIENVLSAIASLSDLLPADKFVENPDDVRRLFKSDCIVTHILDIAGERRQIKIRYSKFRITGSTLYDLAVTMWSIE